MKKRKTQAITAMILITVLLTGCGQGAASTPSAQTQEQAAAAEGQEETAAEDTDPASQEAEAQEPDAGEGAAAMTDAEEGDTAMTAAEEAEIAKKAAGGHPWIDSQARENIYEGMPLSPKDDFHLYVNYDYMMRRKNGEKYDASKNVLLQEVKEILEDSVANNHVEEIVQDYYKAYIDWDARNVAGLEPLRPVVEDIRGISSLDELSAFLKDPDRSGSVPMMLRFMKYYDEEDPTRYVPSLYFRGFGELSLMDPRQYENPDEDARLQIEAQRKVIIHDLTALGWSEEDAGKAYDDFYAVEAALAPTLDSLMDVMQGKEIPSATSDISEIQEWMQAYPISDILSSRGSTATAYFHQNEAYMKAVGDFYKEENLERLKNYHMVSFLKNYDRYCDEETFLLADQALYAAEPDRYEREEDYAAVFGQMVLDMGDALTQAYIGRHDMSKERQEMLDFFEEIRAVYRGMLEKEDWLSDATREKAIEKLNGMKLYALYPDHFKDFSGLDFKGKSMVEIRMTLDRFNEQMEIKQSTEKIVPDIYAFEQMPTLADNAKSLPMINAFMFSIGITKSSGYSSDMSMEEMYGIIGYVLAHEMSHCFDENGSKIDKDGKMNDWWTPEDKEKFEERLQKLIDYYDNITVFEGVNVQGKIISAEATADITGVQAIMELAKTKEGFDYDKFFRTYAEAHAFYSSYKRDLSILGDDSHPLDYLRTNVVVQQFDEFMETYDVKEGDGMYLAPEDRITIW
ncbi:MAG: M13 family metallopeptidase [Lachnospiraceae bacterium]|nr:M13 family metallopeptidase [Lachnospiraceae bacterium]